MTSSSKTTSQNNHTHHDPQKALIMQLCVGPGFTEVAAVLLRSALQALYPTLDIDPNTAVLGTSTWEIVEEEVIAKPPEYQALTDILVAQTLQGVSAIYLEGEHFLTQQPITDPAIHLPVRIAEIANALNLLAPLMPSAYQEQQLDYWNKTDGNGPHWHELSYTLRNIWNVDQVKGWTDDDCRLARQLFHAPDLNSRKLNNTFNTRACLVDIDEVDGQNLKHVNNVSIAVLVCTQASGTSILMFSLKHGYQKFHSLQEFGSALHASLTPINLPKEIQWRLFEPGGNFFDQQACAVIAKQIEAIGTMSVQESDHANITKPALGLPPHTAELLSEKGPGLKWFHDLLPDWLRTASNIDLTRYSRHLKDLAALHSVNAGKSYLDDILPIKPYALKALKDEMLKEHPDALLLNLEQFEIRVESPVIWGTFSVPGKIETSQFSLADLALQNLIALPIGNKTLHSKNGTSIPAWMTVSHIETLITQINIGSRYPALVKSKLLDDPQESSRRQTLYERHLRTQLPLLALQCKISNQAGIDERGYSYVAAIMEPDISGRQVDGQTIVMRPLAFLPERRTTAAADVVTNMFVIGPQDPAAGPCLLYKPMLDDPLTQYPSLANLIYAIQQSASLRNSVLAWLPDAVRSDYDRYVFPGDLPSPWTVAEFVVDPAKLWTMSGPMSLGTQVLNGDLFAELFKANANALIGLADRQSVSNAESRWATFKQAGWLIFNSVLPFLGRTVGVATWIWQIVDQLQRLVEAREHGEKQEQWSALIDVLLNLGMTITLHIVSRNQPVSRAADETAQIEPPVIPTPVKQPIVVKQIADLVANELPPEHHQPLHISGALNRTPDSLATLLDSFKTNKPEGLGPISTETGVHQHLFPHGQKWYAPVGQRWFEVSADEYTLVTIVDPKQRNRTGPTLIHNAKGEWFVDARLRLRGGGLKKAQAKSKALITQKAAHLRTQLSTFETDKTKAQGQLQQARQEMTNAPSTSAQAKRQLYLQKLETLRTDYEDALQKVNTLNVFTPLPDYQQQSLRYIKAQLDLTQAGISEALTTFTPKIRTVVDQIERQTEAPQERHIEDARQMSGLNEDMLARLKSIESRFTELRKFAREGQLQIQSTRKQLPAYKLDDLKALQVTISRNLCLHANTTTTLPDAWSTIDQIVDNADLAVQVLRDTLDERSSSRLDERIDALNSLLEQFNAIDERLQDFRQEYPTQVQVEPLLRLRQQVKEFNQRALSNLVLLLAERNTLRAQPTALQVRPKPKRKLIRTRYNGDLFGEIRLTPIGLETKLVDIKSPLTNKIMATFHEKSPGIWVQRMETSAPAPVVTNLRTSTATGQTLLDGLPAFNERITRRINQPGRTPMGVERLFHQHALRLEQASNAIEQALTDTNLTGSNSTSAVDVKKRLNSAAENLFTQAHSSMLKMIKEQPPTIAGIEWLNNNKEIVIKKTINRRQTNHTNPDYLDEYIISERKTHTVLWYAHFHYSRSWTPDKAFVYARLKSRIEHDSDSATALETVSGRSQTQQIAFYRSEIGLEAAKRLFFVV